MFLVTCPPAVYHLPSACRVSFVWYSMLKHVPITSLSWCASPLTLPRLSSCCLLLLKIPELFAKATNTFPPPFFTYTCPTNTAQLHSYRLFVTYVYHGNSNDIHRWERVVIFFPTVGIGHCPIFPIFCLCRPLPARICVLCYFQFTSHSHMFKTSTCTVHL